VPVETLSAWRDIALRPAELRRVGEHVTTCIACQSRLAAFDEVSTLLRGQTLFEPRPVAWVELRGRIFVESARARSRLPKLASWQGLVWLAIALLLALIVARLLTTLVTVHIGVTAPAPPAPTPTSAPTDLAGAFLSLGRGWPLPILAR
jgi:predicted anti-sigma-YlaC factor YlaD